MPINDESASADLRRRQDRVPGGARNGARALVWGERPSDVLLMPHSPLALADVLAHESGRFDLVALIDDDLADAPETSSATSVVAPITAGRARTRRPRARTNLLTRHEAPALLERCRNAVVEAALVRRRDELRLYLAAGFLRAAGLDAPVLLYPASLTARAEHGKHELRIDDTAPDRNRRALAHCRERFGVDLPAHDPSEPLADYFARLAATVATVDGLDFVFEVAVGNADASFLAMRDDSRVLPDVPARFDAALAMALASDVSLEELHAILTLMPAFGEPGPSADAAPRRATDAAASDRGADTSRAAGTDAGTPVPPLDDASPRPAASRAQEDLARLRACAVKLAARGLEDLPFARFGALPARLERAATALEAALACRTVSALFGTHRFDVRQLARLGSIMELIDKAPAGIESARHADLAFAATAQLMHRARHQAQLIEDEFAALQRWFVLERVPGKSELLQLMDDIGELGAAPGVVDADYFHARRQFMDFSVDKPVHLDDEHRRRLAQLVKVMRFRELFVNNTEYRRALGNRYRGLRTEWAALAGLVDYARELADVLGSETLAGIALADFGEFRTALVEDLDRLRAASDGLQEAVAAFGRHWQSRAVTDLLAHLHETAPRLRAWRASFGDLSAHGALTPAAVLSELTGQSDRDAETERRVADARARIDLSLRTGQTDAAIVAETLDWLRAASRRAAESQLDIGAIVEHLQIA